MSMFCTGCLRAAVNKKFPPLDTAKVRLEAINQSRAALAQMPRRDLTMALDATTLQETLPDLIVASVEGVTAARITLKPQELRFTVGFDRWIKIPINPTQDLDVNVVGSAVLAATAFLDSENKAIRIQPWLCVETANNCEMHISRIQVKGKRPVHKVLVKLIEVALRSFANNINGTIKQQEVRVDTPVFATVEPATFIPADMADNIESVPILFRVVLDNGAILIDESGLHAIAKFENVTGGSPLREPPNELLSARAPSADVDREFSQYRQEFREVVESDFGSGSLAQWPVTHLFMTKLFAAGTLNYSIAKALSNTPTDPFLLRVHKNVGYERFELEEKEIRADQAPDLNCESAFSVIDCNPTDNCNLNKNCDPGWGCPDCTIRWDFWNSITDCGARLGCEADKGRFKNQCEIEKTAFRSECEARKVIARAACEADKAAKKIGCMANQTWLDSWSGALFATIKGNIEINNAGAIVTVQNVSIGPDLQQMQVRTNIAGSSEMVGTFLLTPVDAGRLACQFPVGGQVRFNVTIASQDLILQANLQSANDTQQGVALSFDIPATEFIVRTSEPPVAALLLQNPHFIIACSPLVEAAKLLGLVNVALHRALPDDLIRDTFAFATPHLTATANIPLSEVHVGTRTLPPLQPTWQQKYIGYFLTKPIGDN